MPPSIPELEKQLDSAEQPHERIDALNALAWAIKSADTQRSFLLVEEAGRLAEGNSPPYPVGIADSLSTLARLNFLQGKPDQALEIVRQASEFCEQIAYELPKARLLNTFGMTQAQMGNYTGALEVHLKALEIARTVGDAVEEAYSLNRIAATYYYSGHVVETLRYYHQSLVLYREIGDHAGESGVLHNLATQMQRSGDYEKALEYFTEGLKIARSAGITETIEFILVNMSKAYAHFGRHDEAMEGLNEALVSLQISHHRRIEGLARQNMGHIYRIQKRTQQAIASYQQAIAIAREIDDIFSMTDSFQLIAQLYEEIGDYANALDYQKQFYKLKEASVNQESEAKLRSLEVSYRTRLAEAEAEQQRQLRERERQHFEYLSSMKDDVLNAVSHDLKNPLTGINMAVYRIRKHGRVDDTRGKEILKSIEVQVIKMRDLITDLLDLAKLETGQMFDVRLLNIVPFVQEIIDEFSESANHKNICLIFNGDDSNIQLPFDPRRLHQVFDNLLSNAIKYSPEDGRVEVILQQRESELYISITDTGQGIPSEAIPHLFERFFRVEGDANQAIEGTGLGLAISKAIVEQHGGKIWAESEIGNGSAFNFTLPLSVSDEISRVIAS